MSEVPSATAPVHPTFMTVNGRRLFALEVPAVGACRGALLYVAPFGEEMNRYRSHASAVARQLASQGWHVLMPDLYGTGESDGALTDADCGLWLQDLKAAAQALTARTGAPLHLWGVRTGALLAAALAADADLAVRQLLLWHPVLDGKIFVNQYLRLRLAAQVVNQGEKETTEQIRARLKAGEVLEVAAYPLTAALVDGLAASRLGDQIAGFKGRLALLEAASKGDQPLSVPARKLADALSAAGVDVDARSIQCPMIWQVHERVPAPTLSAETLALMEAAA